MGEKFMKKSLFFILSLLLVLFFSCEVEVKESSNSEKKLPPTEVIITGSVVDGEIEGATVKLVKIEDDSELTGTDTTDENGSFSIEVEIPAGESIEDYMLKAEGGVDISSGEDQDGIVMTRPLEGESNQDVTPITSLLTEEVKETLSGKKAKEVLAAAKIKVAGMLGLTEADVTKNPLDDDKILRNASLLHKLAKKIKKNDRAKAFVQLRTVLAKIKDTLAGKDFAEAISLNGPSDKGYVKGLVHDNIDLISFDVTDPTSPTARSAVADDIIDLAIEDKETVELASVLPGSDNKAKLRKLALMRGILRGIIVKVPDYPGSIFISGDEPRKSYRRGSARVATYIATMLVKIDKKSLGKLLDANNGILKNRGINTDKLASLGSLDFTSAKTAKEKADKIKTKDAFFTPSITDSIKNIIDDILKDDDFKKESSVKALTKDSFYSLASGYLK